MPAGCEFICKNEKCKEYKNGLVITGDWPLGRIELVLNANNVKKIEPLRDKLIQLKDEGRKYAKINLPNTEDIPIEGYRIEQWCEACYCIWTDELIFSHKDQSLDELIKESPIKDKCPKCGGELLSFNKVIEKGIKCPCCKEDTKQSRWFSNLSEYKKEKDNEKA